MPTFSRGSEDEEFDSRECERRHARRVDDRGEIGIGWGDKKIYVKGVSLLTGVLIAFMALVILLFVDFRDEMKEDHQIAREATVELAYLFTLLPEERKALGLEMPESLARKLYKRDLDDAERIRQWKRYEKNNHNSH